MFWMRQLMLKGSAASALFYFAVAAPLQGQRYIRRRAYRTGFTITGASECEGHRKTLRAVDRVQTAPNRGRFAAYLGARPHRACPKEAYAAVTRRKCCRQLKQNTGEILKARVGFEPTNGGFADLSLGPLGYRARRSPVYRKAAESVSRAVAGQQ